jgi:hypothetical protein
MNEDFLSKNLLSEKVSPAQSFMQNEHIKLGHVILKIESIL